MIYSYICQNNDRIAVERTGLSKTECGRRGEDEALAYLLGKGMRLRHRNWRNGRNELDLVMEDGENVRIVEVRSRTLPAAVPPQETVGTDKRRRLMRAASAYAGRYRIRKEIVFDIVSVLFAQGTVRIAYFPDAFLPLDNGGMKLG